MTGDTREYLGDQLALFQGGYQHIMVEFTAHLTGSGDTVPVGVRITDHATGDLIAYQVPVTVGSMRHLEVLGVELANVLRFCREQLSPF